MLNRFHVVGLLVLLPSLTSAATIAGASPNPWPATVFSPYVDMTLWPPARVDLMSQASGAKHYTLAFLVANASGGTTARWGGYDSYPVSNTSAFDADWDFGYNLITGINNLRAGGGDVTVSFGGASGTPLDVQITNQTTLNAEYQRIIDVYKLKSIDFDVEGAWIADAASIARRSAAIKALQTANPSLKVSFTLPVLPTGLTAEGINVLTSALNAGVRLDIVNIMAMDYGDGAAPNPSGKMADYAIQAATSTESQVKSLLGSKGISLTDAQVWSLIGITPMIGINDVQTEIFDMTEAQELLNFANLKHVGLLSMWSATRDHAGTGSVDATNSGLAQTDYAYSSLYSTFAVPEPGTVGLLMLAANAGLICRPRRGVFQRH